MSKCSSAASWRRPERSASRHSGALTTRSPFNLSSRLNKTRPMPVLASHMDVEAVWCFSDPALAVPIERGAAESLKRVWIDRHARDWMGAPGEGRAFLDAATEVKTVWVPYGA